MLWQGAVNVDGTPTVQRYTPQGGRSNVRLRPMLFDLLGRQRRHGKPITIATCWHRLCLAPEHLLDVSKAEMMRGASKAGRLKNPARDANQRRIRRASGKLDMGKAREIRRRKMAGETLIALGAEFGVHHSMIHRIVHNKAWAEHAKNASVFNMVA